MAEKKSINRRQFIKNSALLSMSGFIPASGIAATRIATNTGEKFMNFNYKPNGKFKILQLTDTHYIADDPRSERALKNVCEMLDAEKPDLVIHTGDIIFGKPAEKSVRELFAPISERKIPFAVALGNHDSDFDLSRKEIFDVIKSLPYNINSTVTGLHGVSNDIITLSKENDNKPQWVFYLFDSNNRAELPGFEKSWGYIHIEEINWYRKHSQEFTKLNGGEPIPSLSFFHIPLPEYGYAFKLDKHRIMKGNYGEEPCAPDINSGLFVSMREMGDMKAVICGHDHDDDFAMKWNDIFLMYGRFSGCDTVYNNLKPNGARIIELTQDDTSFRSWVRLYGGEITQNLKYPDDFRTY
jgi:predicted phosphodiesterase